MRVLVCVLVASVYASIASAYLLENESFDDGGASWSTSSEWGGPYFYTHSYLDSTNTIVSFAGWGSGFGAVGANVWYTGSVWQESAFTFTADTEYTLTVVWRNPPDDGSLAESVRLAMYDASVSTNWTTVAAKYVFSNTSAWVTTDLVFDTTTNASVVGHPIAVSFDLTSTAGVWMHADSISLTANFVAPVVSGQPADATVYTGVAATFSIEALGAPEPSVQWYEINGGVTNPVAGATNLSYTTPPATLAMDGRAYFAEASNVQGTDVSDPATLSVVTPAEDANEIFSVQLGDSALGDWQPLGAEESTGAHPMTNWNAVSVDTFGGSWVEQTFLISDQYGIDGGVELIVRGASDADAFDYALSAPTAMDKMMNNFISTWWRAEAGSNALGEGIIELVLTNLDNAVSYNVYVYLADPVRNDPAAGGREADIDAGTGVTNYTGMLPVSLPTLFNPSTNQDPLGTRDPGNYVRLTGITPVSGAITITVSYYDPPWEGWGAGVSGLQLVEESRDTFGPLIDPHPVNQRVVTNTTATLIAAAFGSPLPTVQWYEIDGGVTSMISGATSPIYTTPPVTDATSGRGYFMAATSGLGTTNSAVAYVTGAHMVSPAAGLLQVDQYYVTDSTVAEVLDPVWRSANAPAKTRWIDSFVHQSDLPDNCTERIYGWFTPPVTTNYVFFISSDDDALLRLSTDDNPANARQIAYEEFWSADGTSWTSSGGNSLLSQKRSDQFVPIPFLPGEGWPTGNTISLTAGVSYYIEVGHRQGGGGQSAGVTYKFAGDPDPADGAPTLITADQISTLSAPDTLLPMPVPLMALSHSGGDLMLSGSNGRVNSRYEVLSIGDLTEPPGSWSVEEAGFLDASGSFMSTTDAPDDQSRFYRMRLPE